MTTTYAHQGTGQRLQKELLGEWYQQLAAAPERGEPVAYLFISGNIVELLRVFGFHVVYPEVNALQCGIKKVAGDLIQLAENVGYSPDVCGYVKNDIGLDLRDRRGPFGRIPAPDLLVCNYSGCTTYIKWFEALAERFGCPLFVLDVPYLRDREISEADIRYVTGQMRELIEVCERITGRRYDEERLREHLRLAVRAEDLWVKILHAARHQPSPFDAYFEAVFFMAPIYVLRGTEACVRYYEAAWAEIEERLRLGLGPVPRERFRVVLEGPPPWPHFRAFWEMFKAWDVCVVASSYAKVGGLWDTGFRHDPSRPLESLAEYAIGCYTNLNLGRREQLLRRYVEEYRADGLVIHSVKSCRAFSVGQADFREVFSKRYGIPTLFVESDLADPRYFQAAQMKNRIDAFFEALEHRKLVEGQATSPTGHPAASPSAVSHGERAAELLGGPAPSPTALSHGERAL